MRNEKPRRRWRIRRRTMTSPKKRACESPEPLSTPVPMPPSMLSREALVIWMFRIAINEPIIAASTAIQVVVLARLGSAAAGLDATGAVGSVDIDADRLGLDMAGCSGNRLRRRGGSTRCAGR